MSTNKKKEKFTKRWFEMRNIRDKNIVFNEEEHTYTYKGVPLMSVTTFLEEFSEPFDVEANSKRISEREGVSQDSVKKRWEKNKEFALDFGTKIHDYAEKKFKGYPVEETSDEKELKYRAVIDRYVEEHPNLRFVEAELPLASPLYKLGGTADLLLRDDTGKIFLYDWKTSKEINQFSKYNDKLLFPLEYMDNCNFNKYALQLNVYNYMLNKKFVFPTGMYIIHLTEGNYKEYKVPFLQEEIRALLTLRLQKLLEEQKKKENE